MYALGIDVGSSSVKVSLLHIATGKQAGSSRFPKEEMPIEAPEFGFAEQSPEDWWDAFLLATKEVLMLSGISATQISCIGIAYQMHGLVVVDKSHKVIRPSIIWCDSRAVAIGEKATTALGYGYCTDHLLNAPGNFTASKLKWVKENEPEIYDRTYKWMLPGDYIAMRLSGEVSTTASGLSEGIFWDFKASNISDELMEYYGFDLEMVPDLVPSFGRQAEVNTEGSVLSGLKKGTPISYRAGDQPNNAFSLNVLNPGEIAATAGTSGVIYGVTDQPIGDRKSRVNTFLHVNNERKFNRNGILLCINGTGILNSWLRKNIGASLDYEQMNNLAKATPIGAEGLKFFPFGNGAERVLQNQQLGASMSGVDFNRHTSAHIYRAAQEGIVFALKYGFEVLNELGVIGKTIRAGKANMFLSPLFKEAFVNTVDARLELYKTDGAEGAARGAALGAGYYGDFEETFSSLKCLESVDPNTILRAQYEEKYQQWKSELLIKLKNNP